MTRCKCGLDVGDRVRIVGWNGQSPKGCWADGMSYHTGKECKILHVGHHPERACIAELDKVVCLWETQWLQKIEPYTLF